MKAKEKNICHHCPHQYDQGIEYNKNLKYGLLHLFIEDDDTGQSKCDCLFGEYAEDPDGPNGRHGPVTGNNREEVFAVCNLVFLKNT